MKVVGLLVALLALVVLASAYQRAFYGGSFKQANGLFSPVFAAYDANSNGWREVSPPDQLPFPDFHQLFDLAPVGEDGVFAVGSFLDIYDSVPSFSVAFFDGKKWCPIRHGLATTSEQNNWDSPGIGSAVWCNNATSCYVAGRFSDIENVPENAPNNPRNFAHYVRDAETGEWLFDPSILEWNSPSLPGPGQPLPTGTGSTFPLPGTLQGVPAHDPEYFFVGMGTIDGYGVGFADIYRGGRGDAGWLPYLNVENVFASGAQIRGFDVDDDAASPAVYVVSSVSSGSPSSFAKKCTVLLRPCSGGSCPGGFVTSSTEWVSLVPPTDNLVTLFDVVAVNATTRYFLGQYSPGTGFSARNVVLKQDGFSSPVPVGAPFSRAAAGPALYRVGLYEDDKPYVIGAFRTANLFYPDDTDDFNGPDQADIRELDSVHYIAIYEDGRWTSHFGGGLAPHDDVSDDSFARSLAVVHNPSSNVWYFTSPYITFVHNVKAEGLAYFDDSEDLHHKNIYALFTRRISRRASGVVDSVVYDVACETDECKWVYAGGNFGFHGPDTLGAIAKVEVRRENPTVVSVGGGLWFTDNNVVPTDPSLQFAPGIVYALRARGDFVYAGGRFSRGKNGYVCLNNLARIHHSDSEAGTWESLGGGCDNEVYDLHFWGDDLYVAGAFAKCGSVVVNRVTAYQSGEYRSLNNGLDGTAYSLEYFQGRMIVGGDFSNAGGLPVGGVASWDGQKWRALQAACTDDCVPGDLPLYFGHTAQAPDAAIDLRASADGTVLYARARFEGNYFLGQWQYFDQSDNGRWTVKGGLLRFGDVVLEGDALINNGTQLVVAGMVDSPTFTHSGLSVHAYSLENENWVDNDVIFGAEVYVVRSSASTLSSFLSFFF